MKKIREQLAKFDKTILFIPAIIVIALGVLITIFATQAETVIMAVRTFLGDKFGWYYLLFGLAAFLLLLYLAFSKVGKIRLGKETDKPMKLGTYGILIFTSTMAADILFYAMHEWTYYFNSNRRLTHIFTGDSFLGRSILCWLLYTHLCSSLAKNVMHKAWVKCVFRFSRKQVDRNLRTDSNRQQTLWPWSDYYLEHQLRLV